MTSQAENDSLSTMVEEAGTRIGTPYTFNGREFVHHSGYATRVTPAGQVQCYVETVAGHLGQRTKAHFRVTFKLNGKCISRAALEAAIAAAEGKE